MEKMKINKIKIKNYSKNKYFFCLRKGQNEFMYFMKTIT